tara:strand:- start:28275 stop:28670 length:396 start_codon:yes stop_codon:yes gene_type:complete
MSRLTNFPNGIGGYIVDDQAVAKEANYTIVINTDSGKTFTSMNDGQVFQLPSLAVGNVITFVNMAPDGTAGISISPDALDGIGYAGSDTDNKDVINTKATSKRGDFITIASEDGVVSWKVVAARGVWAKEA